MGLTANEADRYNRKHGILKIARSTIHKYFRRIKARELAKKSRA
jgi:hypothetical protein